MKELDEKDKTYCKDLFFIAEVFADTEEKRNANIKETFKKEFKKRKNDFKGLVELIVTLQNNESTSLYKNWRETGKEYRKLWHTAKRFAINNWNEKDILEMQKYVL